MEKNKFYIKRTEDAKDLPLPQYMSEMASGLDLYANVFEDTILKPSEIKLIATGISIHIPSEFEAQIRPRSGLALKHGISMVNTPGTIDADYRGEIKVILINFGKDDFTIKRGQRIAQMVINKIEKVNFIELENLDESQRGNEGFGHTGV